MVREHRQHLLQLRALADTDLRALLAAAEGLGVAGTRNLLIAALPELLAPYLTASGELAAVLFEDLRAEAARRGTFYAAPADSIPASARVDALSRWAVAPLADDALDSTVFTRLSGSAARMIMDASRDTMAANGSRERVGFQRMPRPGACAFCQMLASRGAVYSSDESAGGRVTYSRDGKSWTGTSSHDDCHCVVMPVYSGTEMASLAQAEQERFEGLYVKASKAAEGGGAKAVLASWRKVHGTK